MDLPNAKYREKYKDAVEGLEAELKSATSSDNVSDLALHSIQQKLDLLANKYQDDEKIGTARYKLYEMQAYIHYFEHQDDKAWDFINLAIDMRGNSYQSAEKLKHILTSNTSNQNDEQVDEQKLSKAEKRKRLIGLEGWLAFFVVGQFLALLMTIYNFFQNGSLSSSDIDVYNEYQPGLGDTLQSFTMLENVALIVAMALMVTTLIFLFRRDKIAKGVAITTLIFLAVYSIADYAIASSIFESSGLTQYNEVSESISKAAGNAGRNILVALIWVPYFLISKRVKATLTR